MTKNAKLDSLSWVCRADPPRVGYWLARVRIGPGKYGPLTPAAIVVEHTTAEPGLEPGESNPMDRSPFFAAYLAGEPVSIWTLLQRAHTAPEKLVRLEQEISRQEYLYRLADMIHARDYRPNEPTGKPKEAVNWLEAATPW